MALHLLLFAQAAKETPPNPIYSGFEPKLPTLGAGLDPDLAFSRTRSRAGGASPSARSISLMSREEGSDEERVSPRMEEVKKEKRDLLAQGL